MADITGHEKPTFKVYMLDGKNAKYWLFGSEKENVRKKPRMV